MNLRLLCALSLASTLPLGACADATSPGPEGPQVELGVAPLTLPGATDACYKIGVYNGDPGEDPNTAVENGVDTVWTRANICASQYGASNGISYVGPCDASVETDNYIALTIEGLYSGGAQGTGTEISTDTYRNPCPNDAPCIQHFECKENADVFVEFNLTIMRDAQQGFFDIAVNFEDVFCSAKFDTCYAATKGRDLESHGLGDGTAVEGIRYLEPATGVGKESTTTAILAVPQEGSDAKYLRYTLSDDSTEATATATTTTSEEKVEYHADGKVKAVRTLTFVDAIAGTSTTATIKDSSRLGDPIGLLFGDNGREHTAVAALACSAGAESGVDTELVFGPVLVMCQDAADNNADVIFSIDLSGAVNTTPDDGAAGNHTVTEIAENGTHTLNYALYFGDEDLACESGVAGSCHKVYYNIAFNIEKLAADDLTGCGFLSFATAQDTAHPAYDATTGAFALDNAAYPLIGFANTDGDKPAPIPFDTAGCTINPVNGEGSHVKTHYIDGTKAGAEAAYHSTGDAASKYANDAVSNFLSP